jgi:ribonuclease HI
MKIIDEDGSDVLCIQEPYVIHNKIAGIPRKYKIFASGEGRHRAAIVVPNNQIDSILIRQLSDEDTAVLEIVYNKAKIIIASMYFDINRQIEDDLNKIEAILQHAKGAGVIIAMDSNSRSTSWHDSLTNSRGRILEEFLISKHLHIMNEESTLTTYWSSRGSSNVDLTVISNQLLRAVEGWEISDQESCSDHSIIKFAIGQGTWRRSIQDCQGARYIVKNEDLEKFQGNLLRLLEDKLSTTNTEGGTEDLDAILSKRADEETDIEKLIEVFHEVLKAACDQSFRKQQATRKIRTNKSVPWWTEELTVMRKRTNALRRRFQRTRLNEGLREQRKTRYLEEKARYETTIKREKIQSWKEYCNLTTSSNPWNEVYKLAAGKTRTKTQITTLRKPDGSLTEDMRETLQLMMEHFTPEDKEEDDTDYHKLARAQAREPSNTADDKDFTVEETRNAVASMNKKKAPGEDGITGEVYKSAFEILPRYITAMYNGCLRRGVFPKRWKTAKLIPIVKPGKENSDEVSKYRPISLLNTGGKILEKLLINRINHQVFSHDHMSKNQYGFMPQRSTTDAAMAVKGFVEEGLAAGDIIVLISLDVKGAFDAAWWPSILNGLQASNCPKNLYNLSKSYFSQRSAVISSNNVSIQRTVTKGSPQGSCCGPGYWNIQYNSLLNLQFTKRTKAVAFADDLILAIRSETIRAAENISNVEMSKITKWAKNNKINFNEEKSKVMVISRRKRKENKEVNIYLNTKSLQQVTTMKYLGIIIDNKFKFSDHIKYTAERSVKLIYSLSKSAKLTWGLNHEALLTIYKGAILPLLLYGAPVWAEAMKFEYNRIKYIRVQRLMNIKIAKAFRTTSSEALCILAGTTPIIIRTEEAAKQYTLRKRKRDLTQSIDLEVEPKDWPHPADVAAIFEVKEYEDQTIQIYTDGSKTEQGVGSGVAIFTGQELVTQLKYKLDNRCSNNQAEQLAIAKALEALESIFMEENSPRTAAIITDSRVALDSIKNFSNHSYLIEEIRKSLSKLARSNWTVAFSWVKSHAGIFGNELADQLAKAAARDKDMTIDYSRIPTSTLYRELEVETEQKWQKNWEESSKAALTKQFFPSISDRLKLKINVTSNFTAIVTGHGKTRAYLHRFKLLESATCLCNQGDQTTDHLLYHCTLLQYPREILKKETLRHGTWPLSKHDLITNHLKSFLKFTNSIDFEKL